MSRPRLLRNAKATHAATRPQATMQLKPSPPPPPRRCPRSWRPAPTSRRRPPRRGGQARRRRTPRRGRPEADVVAPVAEVAAVAPEPVLTAPSVKSTRAPPRAWDIALDMPAGISAPFGYFDPAGLGKKVSERAPSTSASASSSDRVAMLAASASRSRALPPALRRRHRRAVLHRQQTPLQTLSSCCSTWDCRNLLGVHV